MALGLAVAATFAVCARGDPGLVSSTYLGGSGGESGARVAVDRMGNVYMVGTTTSRDFPTTAGAYRELTGNQDAFVAKFSPDGALIYSTYIGGACEDEGRDIAVDGEGNAYITGRIGLCHFSTTPSGVLVAKLSPTGSLVHYTILGGSLADSSIGLGIAVDAGGNTYVTGLAECASHDFPTTAGAFQTNECGGFLADGFVAKLDPSGTNLVYCTYLCGAELESPNAIAIDSAGNAYIAGSTFSHDFPTVNAFQGASRVGPAMETGFVCKLNSTGSKLIYSTYLGGTTRDRALGMAVDRHGNAYVTGDTMGGSFPTTTGVVQPTAPDPRCYYAGTCADAFITKFSPEGSLIYSTFLAAEGDDSGERIAVDAEGNTYVAGSTASVYFPIRNAFQVATGGVNDAFVTKLNPDATRILFSSYLGGGRAPDSAAITEGWDQATGIALDPDGNISVGGYTVSTNFPTTPNAVQPKAGGGNCFLSIAPCGDSFLAKIADGPSILPAIYLSVAPTEVPSGGTITARWSGIPAPTRSDQLVLFRLGDGMMDTSTVQTNYLTTGLGADTLVLKVPGALPPGSYELRLMNPGESGLFRTIARSEPLTVGEAVPQSVILAPALESGRRFRLRVTGISTGTYHLEAAQTLAPADWRVVASLEIGADHSGEYSEAVSSINRARFYRVTR